MTDPLAAIGAFLGLWALAIIFALGTIAVLGAVGGWVLMISLGDLHRSAAAVPALGYLATAACMWAIGVVGALIGARSAASFKAKTS